MYVRPAFVNTGGGVAGAGVGFEISFWLGVVVASSTLLFASMALLKIIPRRPPKKARSLATTR